MMYFSQPPGPMFPHGRAVLIPRIPMGTAPMVNPHGGLSQQPVPPYPGPGPNPPPGIMAMPPQTMYNPYLAMNPNFSVPMYPQTVTAPPGSRPARPETEISNSSERGERLAHSSPVGSMSSSSNTASPEKGVATLPVSVSNVNSNSPASIAGKVSAGRRNYRVAQSPCTGAGGASGASVSSVGRGGAKDGGGGVSASAGKGGGSVSLLSVGRGGAGEGVLIITGESGGGVSSTSVEVKALSSDSVVVKAVSSSPKLATRVETPMGESSFSERGTDRLSFQGVLWRPSG